ALRGTGPSSADNRNQAGRLSRSGGYRAGGIRQVGPRSTSRGGPACGAMQRLPETAQSNGRAVGRLVESRVVQGALDLAERLDLAAALREISGARCGQWIAENTRDRSAIHVDSIGARRAKFARQHRGMRRT